MSYKLTDKCPLTVILQLVGDQTYDLSAYGSKEEAWDAEKGEYWVEGSENINAARAEFMGTLYEYSQEEIVSAALDEQAWPFDWGYVTEIEGASSMKNIRLYTVEWTEGYDNAVEYDVTYGTILSWFADDTVAHDWGLKIASSDYAKELKIVRDLPRGCMYDLHHGSVTPAVMRITTTTDIEQGYCQIDGGAVYECWYPKNRTFWNGWACPAGLTAKSLCDFLAVSLEGRSNPADLELCTELLTSIVPQVYGDLTIYGIGDGLIWDECTADGNVDAYRAEDAE